MSFIQYISVLPTKTLEGILPQTIKLIADKIRENRRHKGLIKAIECLAREPLEKLDFGALFSGVRLYGDVNRKCKLALRWCVRKMHNLTNLNLSSKCDDATLLELAKHCKSLEEISMPLSDITDRGLLALCGIDVPCQTTDATTTLAEGDGCFKLIKLGIHNCVHITAAGVGSCLRNLPRLKYVSYDKLVESIEMVIVIDGDYIKGKKQFMIKNLDEFSEFYNFESRPYVINTLLRVCPNLESLRFFTSDEGCHYLSKIPNIKVLQLETEDLGSGFQSLLLQYSNLKSLHLTFRKMSYNQVIDMSANCPHLEIIRLIGMGIENSQELNSLQNKEKCLRNLRVLDVRLHSDEHPLRLLHFLIDYSLEIEDVTVSTVCSVFESNYLMDLMKPNSMRNLQKLALAMSPNTHLTTAVARRVIDMLPNLNTLGLTRWNITSKEIKNLKRDIQKKNLDIKLV